MNFPFDEIYPLTIVSDRYTGVYSGGNYTAWNCEPCEIPEEIGDDDVTCSIFWANFDAKLVGFGETPREAALDLYCKIKILRSEKTNAVTPTMIEAEEEREK